MPYPLSPALQHYAWGGKRYLYDFMERPPTGKPAAELWLGAHSKAPATLTNSGKTLPAIIAENPAEVLGQDNIDRFGPRLPYLLKVLDVREMLSIQVHPNKQTAEAGFAREEATGIARTAPNRNYRDDNHKPELGVAISDFYLLHGFRDVDAIRETLNRTARWRELIPIFENGGIAGLYAYVMRADQETIDHLLQNLAVRLMAGQYDRTHPNFWARRAMEQYTHEGHYDRGIFSIYWFNLVHLRPGEGVFQAAGIPHAYLEGQCIELMADSDNVLRGGLTRKHIDVSELLSNTSFDPVTPVKLLPLEASDGWHVYITPAADFQLSYLKVFRENTYEVRARGPEILLLFSGNAMVGDLQIEASRRVVFLEDEERITISTESSAVVFRAGVGEVINYKSE